MQQHKRINGRNVLDAIRAGSDHTDLKARYGLSTKGLCKLFDMLVGAGLIAQFELFQRYPLYREKMENVQKRDSPRARLSVPLYVYDVESSATGVLRDISRTGMRVAGLQVKVGEMRTFQIPVDLFIAADPLLIVAKCQWFAGPENSRKYTSAGFEIVNISETDASVLSSFLELMVLSASGQWDTLT